MVVTNKFIKAPLLLGDLTLSIGLNMEGHSMTLTPNMDTVRDNAHTRHSMKGVTWTLHNCKDETAVDCFIFYVLSTLFIGERKL